MGIFPVASVARFAGLDGRGGAVRGDLEPAGVDGAGDGAEEAQAVLQVPDAGAGEGVPVQRVRVEAEALGVGPQPEPDGATGQDLVPESPHEEQEELAATGGADAEQQQRHHQQPEPSREPSPCHPSRALAASRSEPPRGRQRGPQAPSVTNALLRGCPRPSLIPLFVSNSRDPEFRTTVLCSAKEERVSKARSVLQVTDSRTLIFVDGYCFYFFF